MSPDGNGFSAFYTADERAVFGYALDGQQKFADPMAIQRRLTAALSGNPNAVIEQSNSEDPLARAVAEERLWPAVRRAFALPDFNPETGQGTTDATCQRLLDEFLAYANQKKTTVPPWPTGQQLTAASPEQPISAMKPSSGFG